MWHSTVVGDIILVGVVLFAAMKLKLVFPHSLKGLLFYVQTAYYTTEYFPISFWDIRKYVSLYIAGIRLTKVHVDASINVFLLLKLCVLSA